MSNTASITVNDAEVKKLLQTLLLKIQGGTGGNILNQIGDAGLTGIMDVFDSEGDPPRSWPDLQESTKRQRAKIGKWPGKMLQRTGRLKQINYQTTGGSKNPTVRWGTKLAYARVHQYGYAPRKIPARPYLVLTDKVIDKIKSILTKELIG